MSTGQGRETWGGRGRLHRDGCSRSRYNLKITPIRGVRPTHQLTGWKNSRRVIFARTLQGIVPVASRTEFWDQHKHGKVGASTSITFLKRLMLGARRPICLILDGHPSHRDKLVTKYIETLGGTLRLFFLPANSPELNPDELVWNSLKNTALGRRAHHDKAGLKQAAISHLRSLQKAPCGAFG